MLGTSALAVAVLFALFAAARLRRAAPWLVPVLMTCGLAGGLMAVVHWTHGADSRWLVGGVLLVLGETAALVGTRIPALRVVTLVLGVLAALLMAVASATAG